MAKIELQKELVDEIKKTLSDIQTHYAQVGRLLLEREELADRLEQIDATVDVIKQTIPILENNAASLRESIVDSHGPGTLDLDTLTYVTEDDVE